MNNRLEQVERGRMAADFLSQAITALRNSGLPDIEPSLIRLSSEHETLKQIVDTARQNAKHNDP